MKTKKIVDLAKKYAAEKISLMMSPSEKKVEYAEKKVEEARKNLQEAEKHAQEVSEEWTQFKKDTLEKISSNEENIRVFKKKMDSNISEEGKKEYEEKVSDLEHKNNNLKRMMGDYKYDGKEKWKQFKEAVKHSTDEITAAWKDLVRVNIEYLK